jgi:penicillin-binding protein 2
MIESPPKVEERAPPLTPQLALRVAMIGTCGLVMFAIIFFRLWFLQVLTGSQYAAQAHSNYTRTIPVAAPRGEILASDGSVMVDSVPAPTVEISAPDLPTPITIPELIHNRDRPPRDDAILYGRLAGILRLSMKPVRCIVDGKPPPNGPGGVFRLTPLACDVAQGVANAPFANVPIDVGVSRDIEEYLAERETRSGFRGVVVEQKWTRQYPLRSLAAQVIGTVGPLSCANPKVAAQCETHQGHFKGIPAYDTVGQSGLEYEYNKYLQGTDGSLGVNVNATNAFEGYSTYTRPAAGENLQVSIVPQLQRVGERSLATSIADNGGSGGAFLAMDPESGQLLAMGSAPTYNPSVFTRPISDTKYNQLFGPNSGDPLINRAIQSAGPDGSTFKVITATAALESGDWAIGDTFTDDGKYCFPNTTQCLYNAGKAAYGTLNLVDALRVSDDVFFYHLGDLMNVDTPRGGPLQQWATRFGIGQRSGIDLPGAATGTLPTPAWRAQRNAEEQACDNLTHPTAMFPNHPHHKLPLGGCGLAIYPFEDWTQGDNVNVAVGQGDVQVTPLQLAVAYAALANGGRIVTPHVGEDIQSANGTILQRIDPGTRRRLAIDPAYLQTILTGLREAASTGTSGDVMGDFPEPVYGKTGTAQYLTATTAETDYAWYACFVPKSATNNRPIVVVVWVEKGGFGDVAAAPVARQILSQWFLGKPGPFKSGNSKTL